jgi:type VI secretion system secreted protein VgrG
MAEIQAARQVEIITPLGDDVLLFHSMTATEELGRLFQFELNLLSIEPNLKFEDLLGQNVTIRLDLPDDKKRYFNGFVSRFSQAGTFDDFNAYSATVHPWLWFLTRTADCRIFQEKKVPDIIKEVFRDLGFTDFEETLSGSYRTWEYCVQYRETDFNFVSRLMEQEGIYYYFKHEIDKHTLVLADSVSSHEAFPGYEKLPYFPPDENLRRERDHIYDWNISQQVQPGIYALEEFDFKKPKANLEVKSSIQREHARAKMEIFDYPGEYVQTGDGEAYARARIEELQAEYEQVQGQGNARGLSVGSLFELTDYLREDQNREYLIVSATHEVESDAYSSGSGSEAQEAYSCSFTALHSKQPYRAPRTTPKPMVQGPQTAIVVGKAGEEIWADKYGRVKIQFHWDRYGKLDENSSCWVRVSHPTAGKNWGSVQIPRIGQEVIVDFLEGDPDLPIITGRVYNADQMPPFELPGSGMVSGMKSNTTPGGGGYNEMSMNDTKGKEQVTVHAQYDMSTTVEHDQTLTVHNNRTSTIDVDDTETVTGNQTISVDGNQQTSVKGNQTLSVDGNQQITVKGNREETVDGTENITINSSRTEHVTGSEEVTIDGATKHAINADFTRNSTGNYTLTSDGNIKTDAGSNWEGHGGAKALLKAPEIKIEGQSKIEIVCGGSSITLEPAKITVSSGSGSIDIHAPGVDVKGGKIQLN